MDWRWTSTVKFLCRWIRKCDPIDQRGWLTSDEAAARASVVGMDAPRLNATNAKRFWSWSSNILVGGGGTGDWVGCRPLENDFTPHR